MWLAIFGAVLAVSAGGAVYLICGSHRFSLIKKLGEKHKLLSWIAAAAIPAVICGSWCIVNIWSVAIVMIHLFIFWMLCDLVVKIVRMISGKKSEKNWAGAAAIAITAVYLAFGWYFAHHIDITNYQLSSDKIKGQGMRIALIADSHLGITLDGEKFAEQMKRIDECEPDIVVVAGDFVDDDSCKADMERSCQALGEINAKYGVYFVFGNHDKGYYSEGYRDFSEEDLRKSLTSNGVIILEDEICSIGDDFLLVGRNDRSNKERLTMEELVNDIDKSKYCIVSDHQPNDYDAEADAGADLVLSGHTHGGPLFPAGQIGVLFGANDAFYGLEHRKDTDFIVTSGISGWALPFKTGTKSEIVIVDINRQN
ncbi:MAG: metallophosphoesterase [Ruminococcus sp.]|nr:metallophosphoesterase [Ruminococcus sp.]